MEVKEIEVVSTLLLLPLFLFGLFFSLGFAVSTTLGGILVIANLFFLNKGVRGALAEKSKRAKIFLQYTLRFVLLISAIYVLLNWKKVNTAGFIVGLSVVFFGTIICSVKSRCFSTKTRPDDP